MGRTLKVNKAKPREDGGGAVLREAGAAQGDRKFSSRRF
jgi:hypothetical protein